VQHPYGRLLASTAAVATRDGFHVGPSYRSCHDRTRPGNMALARSTGESGADTVDNQAVYPQPGSQQPGLGFPLCRLVGIICLASGAVLDAATEPCRGKGSDEQSLLRSMLDTLKAGDILLGDVFFATYFLMCALQAKGADGVFEQQGSRRHSTDFCRGQQDHLIELHKPKVKPSWMSQADYDRAPNTLKVRELRTGGKLLVTTRFAQNTRAKPSSRHSIETAGR